MSSRTRLLLDAVFFYSAFPGLEVRLRALTGDTMLDYTSEEVPSYEDNTQYAVWLLREAWTPELLQITSFWNNKKLKSIVCVEVVTDRTRGSLQFQLGEKTIWGQYHNDDSAAVCLYNRDDDDGNLWRVEHHFHGLLHKRDGAALIEYYRENLVFKRVFSKMGLLHNTQGAAVEHWTDDGQIATAERWEDGVFLDRIAYC